MESGKTSLSSFNHLPYFAHAKITFDHRFTVYISDTSSSYHLHHHHQHHPQSSSPSHITFLIFETLATLTHLAWQMLFEVWIQYSRRLTIQNILGRITIFKILSAYHNILTAVATPSEQNTKYCQYLELVKLKHVWGLS